MPGRAWRVPRSVSMPDDGEKVDTDGGADSGTRGERRQNYAEAKRSFKDPPKTVGPKLRGDAVSISAEVGRGTKCQGTMHQFSYSSYPRVTPFTIYSRRTHPRVANSHPRNRHPRTRVLFHS